VPEQEEAANNWAAQRLVSAEAFDRAVEQHGGDDVQIARELEVMVGG
jgi:Zn-dependent peptidase ImmA (M78 family)